MKTINIFKPSEVFKDWVICTRCGCYLPIARRLKHFKWHLNREQTSFVDTEEWY